MNAIDHAAPVLTIDQAEHAALAARATLDAVQKRVQAADDAMRAAAGKRRELVQRLAQAGTVTAAEQRAAEEAVRNAETSLMLIREAVAGAQAAVQAADQEILRARKKVADERFAAAKAARIKAAERLQQAGLDYGAAAAAFLSTGEELHAAYNLGRVIQPHEISSLRDSRLIAVALPPDVQTAIVQTASVVSYDLAARERATWTAAV